MTEERRIQPGFYLADLRPSLPDIHTEVVEGLSSQPKYLSPKYFYNRRGSELFEQICHLPEYYLTRTEISIMNNHRSSIAAEVGPDTCLIEYGSGNSQKVRILLESCKPVSYIPIDISRDHLKASAARISQDYPQLAVYAVCADYSQPLSIPNTLKDLRRVAFFPGSSIGNFSPCEARAFLVQVRRVIGNNGALVVGVDTKKPAALINAAYNDQRGLTKQFNLNLLAHLNQRIRADFDLEAFEHRAQYKEEHGRVELHLVSTKSQTVQMGNHAFELAKGEPIHTENSYKYSFSEFSSLAGEAGLRCAKRWTDPRELFMVLLLRPAMA